MVDMYKLNQIPSEGQIRKYLRRILFGKNVFCPECRSRKILKYGDRYRCLRCRCKFSLLSHTWLAGMRLSYQKFWLILWSWTKQIPVKQTSVLAKMSRKGIYHWFGLFRSHLPQNEVILSKIVQLDEAFFKNRTLIMGKEKVTNRTCI